MPIDTVVEGDQGIGSATSATLCWQEIHDQLQKKQQEIIDEIRTYPPPIPACDAQFNYLLEQRTAIQQELRRLTTQQQQSAAANDAQKLLAEFIHASPFLNEDMTK